VPSGLDWGVAVLVWLLASATLLAFEAYLQNAHIETGNRLWESVELRRWIGDPRWATPDLGKLSTLMLAGIREIAFASVSAGRLFADWL
jgi:hypothetical protein